MGRAFGLIAAIALAACGGDAPPDDASGPAPCPPGTKPLSDGSCQAAGLGPDGCGPGLEPDGDGCAAILPAAACPAGQVALPGERACRELIPCGAGAWGDIPVDAATVYVDASYVGSDANGSAAKPYPTIGQGLDAAATGGIVAVAAGEYAESVILRRRVRLWGRCPRMTAVKPPATYVALGVFAGGAGSEIHAIAASGQTYGAYALGSVTLDGVWVHDTGLFGVVCAGDDAAAAPSVSVSLAHSLVERAHDSGVGVIGCQLAVKQTVVRGTLQGTFNPTPTGISVYGDKHPGALALSSSLIDGIPGAGLLIGGASATVEGVVIRDARGKADGSFGRGIELQVAGSKPRRASLDLRDALVQGASEVGVHVAGSDATLDRVVIRDTGGLKSAKLTAKALGVEWDPKSGQSASATVTRVVIVGTAGSGVSVIAGHASLESVLVSDTTTSAANSGQGIIANYDTMDAVSPRTSIDVRWSRIARSHLVGIGLAVADGTVDGTAVTDTGANADGKFGDGVSVGHGPGAATTTLVLTGSLVARSARAGLASFGGSAHVGATAFDCNPIQLEGDTEIAPAQFDDLGGNACGCNGASQTCQAVSTNLEPPPQL